ncbi:hypothetical protein CC1G_03953 [Coprinopsis cinerea okayama7|uniref:Uncharacterized protein n=1 Tax=Coprinopsis cinerea (strain Okayama-7 / 130 / ATCC MYA-4618 / FGSC 9003) TaxID=240176 RepID=A8N8A6_COPC7|nr:hypothetical protein CC1G_03953 [Coprinopsis cinerea okayama7\|eukprot:XP_001831062.2 hypothetical protein CC1G_03953 [Coprinopsis cinerea okayama7\
MASRSGLQTRRKRRTYSSAAAAARPPPNSRQQSRNPNPNEGEEKPELSKESRTSKQGEWEEDYARLIRERAAELAKSGVQVDPEDLIKLEESNREGGDDILIDMDHVNAILDYANTHWPRTKTLPTGWSCTWPNWENLISFFYPTSQYFVVIPQIDFIINVRYAIPGEVQPVMFNNDLNAFVFEVVERKSEEEVQAQMAKDKEQLERERQKDQDRHRKLYYLDWEEGELYHITNAHTPRQLARLMIHSGGLSALSLSLIQSDPKGEEVADRILARDASVVPLLEENYLGYTPVPSTDLSNHYLQETEQLMEELGYGTLLDEYDRANMDPELRAESDRAYQQLLHFIRLMSSGREQQEFSRQLLQVMKQVTPEELKPMHDLFQLFRNLGPEHIPVVSEELRRHYLHLEREVQAESQVLGEVLAELKRQREVMKGGGDSEQAQGQAQGEQGKKD